MSALNNWVVKNLLAAAVLVFAIVTIISVLLNVATHHNQVIAVPDMANLSVAEASHLAAQNDIRVEVSDSVYVRRMAKGAVFSQNPKAGTRVKKGRRVFLTINAVVPKKVTMPNLVGYSMRQASAELSSRGLTLGKLIYVDDIATNNVMKQLYKNREIEPGKSIESGAEVSLVVGLNRDDNMTIIPTTVGMKYIRATEAVHDNSLNIGRLSFDKSVKNYNDSLNAVVYKQSPDQADVPVVMGTEVSLYLTVDPEKMPK